VVQRRQRGSYAAVQQQRSAVVRGVGSRFEGGSVQR
jgi:hypothetical protein